MTVSQALIWLGGQLSRAGLENPENEAIMVLAHVLHSSRLAVVLAGATQLSEEQHQALHIFLQRRVVGEPIQYILGEADFYGLRLEVTPEVLIPRPETECLVSYVVPTLGKKSIVLDIATGSGAIALALKESSPEIGIYASDISSQALQVAQRNARRYGLDIHFLEADLLSTSAIQSLAQKADVITANLPYLPSADRSWLSAEVKYEPALALYSGDDGLNHFRRLKTQALKCLQPGAQLWLELDPRNIIQAQAESQQWASSEVYQDLVGRERFLRLIR